MATTPNSIADKIYIKRIKVDGLFGLYSYDLNVESNDLFDSGLKNSLLLLYGDNGSGKTTILKLLYDLLSYRDKKGHKTNIAQIVFKEFTVSLSNEIEISAIRKKAENGSYDFRVYKSGKVLFNTYLKTDSENSIVPNSSLYDEEKFNESLKYISELDINLYFLPDDRNIQTTTVKNDDSFSDFEEEVLFKEHHYPSRSYLKFNYSEERENYIIRSALERVSEWIKSKVLNASDLGEENTNSIYTDIIRRIASPIKADKNNNNFTGIDEENLRKVSKRIEEYSKYGLITSIEFEHIISVYNNSDPEKKEVINRVFEPYINGINSRLNALTNIKNIIDKFINGINSFLLDKVVDFNVKRGFNIINKKGNRLLPQYLSSGEKQLLLLFCNTITARDQATIFIIDEPEISLNIKWQRKIIKYLLELARDSNVQFIMATHSVELITNYNSLVAKLTPINE